jgi:hypothetical protein
MSTSQLRESQMRMARFLRDPANQAPPEGVEPRRLKIYQDLIYNNIEGFISGGFPVLRSLYGDDDWHGLVRRFIDGHRCQTPYFLEISQEFLRFLMEDFEPRDCDPPFLVELAHYEWVELGLDVSEQEIPDDTGPEDILQARVRLSPLAWVLAYRFPVHQIGPGYRPDTAGEPTYLVVYRDRADKVRFMALNAAMARLLELLRDADAQSLAAVLASLAQELDTPAEAITGFAVDELNRLRDVGVVYCTMS